ncbi:Resolvase [Pseudolycoriella hygida]|uniref:Resolvase n=1 Tax=Pseudolycoriella hygida TaxID=35572 RepID=A0A9Q0N8T6_9DIPT|nr:Resolvase [Pseudolycoriella hygida]
MISRYGMDHKLIVDEWIELEMSSRQSTAKRRIDELLEKLSPKDVVIASELSRLGRSIKETLNIVEEITHEKQSRLILIKQNLDLNPQDKNNITNKVMITVFAMVAELERDFISERTKEGLRARVAKGIKLGKPKGTVQKSIHKGLSNFFNYGDTTKIQSDHIKKLRLLLANLNAATKVENMNLPGLGLHKLQGNMKDFWSVKINGSILKELYLEPLNLTVTEASISLGVTRKTLSFLINEKSSISSSMAIRLSAAFPNTSPEYWLNLQQQYDIWNAKKNIDVSHIKVLLHISA